MIEYNPIISMDKRISQLEQVVIDSAKEITELQSELTTAQAENEKLRARVAQLEFAALNAISFMPGGQTKADLRDAYDAEIPATAWLLSKQAEAIGGLYFPGLLGDSWNGSEFNEWLQERAGILRQQADKLEG